MGIDDNDDEEYIPVPEPERSRHKEVPVSTSTTLEIPFIHIDRSRGTGVYPCLSEHLASNWGILSSSREVLEPFTIKTIDGLSTGRYIRCHLCWETLGYKMHPVKTHCDSRMHKERLVSHLQSLLKGLKKKRNRSSDELASRELKRSAKSNNDHIYGPTRTNFEEISDQLIAKPVNSLSTTNDAFRVSMDAITEDDNEIMRKNSSDGVDDDLMSMSQTSTFDTPPSAIQGNVAKENVAKESFTCERHHGVDGNISLENSALLPCMSRKEATQWGPFVHASRKYLKIFIPSQESMRLVKCEICVTTLPYEMKPVQDHCCGQTHQFQLKTQLYSERSTQQSCNKIEDNPDGIPVVPPPPPAPQNHNNYSLYSSQYENKSRRGPPPSQLQPTTWQPQSIPLPPPPPPIQEQTESTGQMGVYQNVNALPSIEINAIKKNLVDQLTAPVRWKQLVQNMVKDGAKTFTECGPGKVLQGLVKKIAPEVTVMSL